MLGSDAGTTVRQTLEDMRADVDDWEHLSRSTDLATKLIDDT